MIPHLSVWVALLAGGSLASCILLADKDAAKGGDEPKTTAPAAVDAARVAAGWQTRAANLLKDNAKATALFGLFTEGGWSDDGQIMVLVPGTTGPADLVYVRPNAKEKAEAARPLQAAEWDALKAQTTAAATLADIDVVAFDALTYEYVHFEKMPNGDLKGVKRIYIRNPGSQPMPEHEKLLKAFETLKPK